MLKIITVFLIGFLMGEVFCFVLPYIDSFRWYCLKKGWITPSYFEEEKLKQEKNKP